MVDESTLLHELVWRSAHRNADAVALTYGAQSLNYGQLAQAVRDFAAGLMGLKLARSQRVGIYLEKRMATVVASFGAPAAGAVFVPINPLLKAEQVGFIVQDCEVQVLLTSPQRLQTLLPVLGQCASLKHVVLTEEVQTPEQAQAEVRDLAGTLPAGVGCTGWREFLAGPAREGHRVIDTDMTAILYTSGSTGRPKGVVLSHRNMVAGAKSVASYLQNRASDTLLAALPLSFDAGFSQLTTGFHAGARVVLLNYLMSRDVLKAMERESVTGLTAVPPLYIQLTQLEWPVEVAEHLRYFANTGGRMPRETLELLRAKAPNSKPYLMYGLTEAFRSTYLPPEQVDHRPDSIGKAIPNAEILVLREDGTECDAGEVGELVHRGPLVGQGYWNDAEKTAERYKLMPQGPSRPAGLQLPEYAVYSGDNVKRDEEGYLYFIGRRDEMIKTSGYRVSPTEVEEVLYATRLVGECAVFGVDNPALGQEIRVVATAPAGRDLDVTELMRECRQRMPAYMVPAGVEVHTQALPRNPNGKIDRKLLATAFVERMSQ